MPYGGPQPYSPVPNRGGGGDLHSLGYKFQDIKSSGLASGKIVWTRSPVAVSNDVGQLAVRLHKNIRTNQSWGVITMEVAARNLANAKWKNPTKSPDGFVARAENRGSSYGLRLAYGAVTMNKGFAYGFALEDSYNSITGPYDHDTEVIGIVAPEIGRRLMERIARMAH